MPSTSTPTRMASRMPKTLSLERAASESEIESEHLDYLDYSTR